MAARITLPYELLSASQAKRDWGTACLDLLGSAFERQACRFPRPDARFSLSQITEANACTSSPAALPAPVSGAGFGWGYLLVNLRCTKASRRSSSGRSGQIRAAGRENIAKVAGGV
jgi:hypothetical protein